MTTIFIRSETVLPLRHTLDHYLTEKSLIHAAMQRYAPPRAQSVLDIGAGRDGRWGLIAAQYTGAQTVVGVELQDTPKPDGFTHWHSPLDFLTWEREPAAYTLILSNPPYYAAEAIIRKAWTLLEPQGRMVMLLRLAFQAGVSRFHKLWGEIWPTEVAVLSRRPSFYNRRTNGTDMALYYWQKDEDGQPVGSARAWRTVLLNYERNGE